MSVIRCTSLLKIVLTHLTKPGHNFSTNTLMRSFASFTCTKALVAALHCSFSKQCGETESSYCHSLDIYLYIYTYIYIYITASIQACSLSTLDEPTYLTNKNSRLSILALSSAMSSKNHTHNIDTYSPHVIKC